MTDNNRLAAGDAAAETLQREGGRLTGLDRGRLAAARRHGDPELVARVDAIEEIDARRAEKRRTTRRKGQR